MFGRQHNAVLQGLGANAPVKHLAGGGWMQHHRRHQPQVVLQVIDLGHQGHVLVYIPAAQNGRLRPHRLEKADPPAGLAGHVQQRQTDGGFATILTGSGNENLLGHAEFSLGNATILV